MAAKGPRRFASITAFQSSSLRRMTTLSRVRPALFTRMSSEPNAPSTSAISCVTAEVSATSQANPRASPPSSAATRSAVLLSRPVTATRAPHSTREAAIARPIPRVLPVTRATRPVRSIFIQATCARSFSTSAGEPHATPRAPGTIRESSPVRTAPGPSSTKSAAGNCDAMFVISPAHFTGDVS